MKILLRRHWQRILLYGGLCFGAADAFLIEPVWVKVNRLSLNEHPSARIIHISDLHYKGNASYLARIVSKINNLDPAAICFTGDIVEDTAYLGQAMDALSGIRAPLWGVPGNHDCWTGSSLERIKTGFRKTGGGWLAAGSVAELPRIRITLIGNNSPGAGSVPTKVAARSPGAKPPPAASDVSKTPGTKRILLMHYPGMVDSIRDEAYDLILAGHSHGGQVRLPFFGALHLPGLVGGYQSGLYRTQAGPLHVNPGLGTFALPVRFMCRPEITLIEL